MLKKTKLAITVSAFAMSASIAGVAFAREGRGRGGPGDNGGPPSPRELERKFDKNNDGKLDDAERTAMMDQKVTEHFQKLDTDGNGAVTLAELKAGMKLRHKHVMLGGPGGSPDHGPHGLCAPPADGDVRIHVLHDDGDDE